VPGSEDATRYRKNVKNKMKAIGVWRSDDVRLWIADQCVRFIGRETATKEEFLSALRDRALD